MKKLLKISALALAMSALLFSCADPNNGTKTPETPTVETVKPSDVTKPEGFTPTEGAKSVKTAEDAGKVLPKIMDEYGQYFMALYKDLETATTEDPINTEELKKMGEPSADEKADLMKKIEAGEDFTFSRKISLKPKSYDFDYGTSELVLGEMVNSMSYKFTNKVLDEEKSDFEAKEKEIVKIDVKDPKKVNRAVKDTDFIKALKVNAGMEFTENKTTFSEKDDMNVVAVFEVEGFTGIVILEMTESRSGETADNAPAPTVDEKMSYTFYDLDGKETLPKVTTPEA